MTVSRIIDCILLGTAIVVLRCMDLTPDVANAITGGAVGLCAGRVVAGLVHLKMEN